MGKNNNQVQELEYVDIDERIASDPMLELAQKLYAEFEPHETETDPRGYTYLKEKAIMRRLNQVFGPFGWQSSMQPGPDGVVICTLRVLVGGEWIERSNGSAVQLKSDPGNEKKTHDDMVKGAMTDSFKRAARSLGIGWYLL